MVAKLNQTSLKAEKHGKVSVAKLQVNKETLKDLTGSEAKKIKGGGRRNITSISLNPSGG